MVKAPGVGQGHMGLPWESLLGPKLKIYVEIIYFECRRVRLNIHAKPSGNVMSQHEPRPAWVTSLFFWQKYPLLILCTYFYVTKFLLEKNADISKSDYSGRTLKEIVENSRDKRILKLLN